MGQVVLKYQGDDVSMSGGVGVCQGVSDREVL